MIDYFSCIALSINVRDRKRHTPYARPITNQRAES